MKHVCIIKTKMVGNTILWMRLPSKARDIYLHFRGAIDTIGVVIKKAGIVDFRSWRFYHRPVNQGKEVALASAFSFYDEIISGIT